MNIFLKSLAMMNRNEKRSGVLLLGITVLKGVSDTIGVASILPFLSILGQPELVQTNPYASMIYNALGFTSVDNFLFALGLLVVIVTVFTATLNAVTIYASNRWIEMREHYLSRRLLQTYLRQPYAYYLGRNTSDMATSILSMARNVVVGVYRPFVNLVNASITLILIAILLLWANPLITISAVATIGLCYLILFLALKGLIKRKGKTIIGTSKAKFRRVNETLTGIKQVKLSGYENYALARYSEPSQELAETRAISSTLNQVPKFALEAFAFGGIVMMTLYLFKQSGGAESGTIATSLPLLGLYAFAGYRLLPVMQMIYGAFLTLRLNTPAVDVVYEDIKGSGQLPRIPSSTAMPMSFANSVKLQSVCYRYPDTEKAGLENINLEIPKGISLGIVGTTGAGKTTLVDVLLGLLEVNGGGILVDDVELGENNMRSWQSSFGYVPQDIFLYDASIAENIAMGIPKSQISMERLEDAAKVAKLHTFIANDLTEGFETFIGERGVRLSGGQRQRLGIARALYRDPQIIVFDEATSALDNTTERELIAQIAQMSGERTIIMIAHRLTTIEKCDQIIVLDKGQIVGKGTYAELLESNDTFKKMNMIED